MKQVPLTASANTGIGLWTMICVGFSQIFGCQSKSLKRKQEKILNFANEDLDDQLNDLGPEYSLVDYRVTWSGKLSVTVSALAVSSEEEVKVEVTPNKKEAKEEGLSNEKMVEILRNDLNRLFEDGEESIGQIVISLRSYKNDKFIEIANEIDENKTVSGAASILKRAINELK